MAIEKVLNTRIQLKYDSFSEWSSKNPTLKAGEVAIAYLTTAGAVKPEAGDTQHPVLFKVGPGKFNDLPWASALAADVHTWAKKSEDDFKTWVKSLIEVADIDAYSKGEIDAKFTANSAADLAAAKSYADSLAGNYDAAGTAQELINALDVSDAAVTGKYVSAVSETDGKISVTRADLPTYNLTTGSANGTVAFNGTDVAVKGLGSAAYTNANAYDAAGAAATAKSEAIAAAATDATSKVNALKDGDVKANANAIAAIKDHATVDSFADVMTEMAKYQLSGDYATKAEAQGYANAKDAAIAEAKKAGTDAAAALEAYKTANNAAVTLKADQTALNAVSAVANAAATQTALTEEINRAKKAEEANAAAIERLTNGVSQEEIDSVNDLINYVNEHGPEVEQMQKDIAANTKAISDEAARADAEEKRLAGLIADNADDIAENARAIAALNAADGKVANAAMADKANSLTDAAKNEVKGVKVDNASNADNATKAADADKLGGAAAADYLKKADAPGYADILTKTAATAAYQPKGNYATAAQGALAETAVQPAALNSYYTKTEADAEFMNSTETNNAIDAKITGLNLANTYEPKGAETRAKAYADGLASNYATAAQGAKADSALQSITTTANGGLKVTGKNQIDIDTDVVFVFDCGSASVNV